MAVGGIPGGFLLSKAGKHHICVEKLIQMEVDKK